MCNEVVIIYEKNNRRHAVVTIRRKYFCFALVEKMLVFERFTSDPHLMVVTPGDKNTYETIQITSVVS